MQLSPKKASTISVVAFIVHLALFAGILVVGKGYVKSMAVEVAAYQMLGGVLIWLMLILQFRQRHLAMLERQEADDYQRMRREGKDASVFESSTIEESLKLAQRRSQWMDKYLVPSFSVLTALYLIGINTWLLLELRADDIPLVDDRNVLLGCGVYLAGFAVIAFLFARYTIGLSQHEVWRELRAGGSYLNACSGVCFLLAICVALAEAGYSSFERIGGYVLAFALMGIGVEMALNLVLDFYRPRVAGQYSRAAYESRILGLFSEPGGILRTAAHALDYQFGFKVSESWFYKLLEKAVLPLVALQIVILYLMTSVAIVPTGHVAVLERFGRPVNLDTPKEAGAFLKYPWPIDRVYSYPLEQVRSLDIGFERKEPEMVDGREVPSQEAILWTKEHWEEEFPFLVAYRSKATVADDRGADDGVSDEAEVSVFDMLVIGLNVHYRISDLRAYAYGRERSFIIPEECLEAVCYQQTMLYTANHDINDLLGAGRFETTQMLKQRMQAEVDRHGLGIELLSVTMEAVHPPLKVAESFEMVVAALQQRQGAVYEGHAQRQEILTKVEGEKNSVLAQARAERLEKVVLAKADALRFEQQLEAYRRGRESYLWREYLRTMEKYLPGMRKTIFIAPDNAKRWTYELDLTEQRDPGLFEGLDLDIEEEPLP